MEWQGKTYYVTGTESGIQTLRATTSVRVMMEETQLETLINHVGNFVNNYTAEVFRAGILRQHSKSALSAGMSLHVKEKHNLDRFQSLAQRKVVYRALLDKARR